MHRRDWSKVVNLYSSQKNGSVLGTPKASFLGGRKLRVNKYTAAVGGRSTTTVCAVADPDRPLWFPGSTPPPWLDGSLPGDFGFDPLGLGKWVLNMNTILTIYASSHHIIRVYYRICYEHIVIEISFMKANEKRKWILIDRIWSGESEMECSGRASALQMGNVGCCWDFHSRIPDKDWCFKHTLMVLSWRTWILHRHHYPLHCWALFHWVGWG